MVSRYGHMAISVALLISPTICAWNRSITSYPNASGTLTSMSSSGTLAFSDLEYNASLEKEYLSEDISVSLQRITPQSLYDYCVSSVWEAYSNWGRPSTKTSTSTWTERSSPYGVSRTTWIFTDGFRVSVKPPCCGACYIWIKEAFIRYWPTPAPQPAVTRIVRDRITFISPSVYMFFSRIGAGDACRYRSATFDGAVLSFDASEISSVLTLSGSLTAVPFNFADLNSPCLAPSLPTSWSNSYGGVYTPSTTTVINGVTYQLQDRCQPYIAIPSRLTELAPEWKNCKPVVEGVWDPPHALVPETTMEGANSLGPGPSPSQSPDPPPRQTGPPQGINPPTTSSSSPNTATQGALLVDPPQPGPVPVLPQPPAATFKPPQQSVPASADPPLIPHPENPSPAGTPPQDLRNPFNYPKSAANDPPSLPNAPIHSANGASISLGSSGSSSDSGNLKDSPGNQATALLNQSPPQKDPSGDQYRSSTSQSPSRKDPANPASNSPAMRSPTTRLSDDPSNSQHQLEPPLPSTALTIASQVISVSLLPSAQGVAVGSQTMIVGGPILSIFGVPISIGPSNVIVAGSSTLTLAKPPVTAPAPAAPVVTVGTEKYTILNIAASPNAQNIAIGAGIAVVVGGNTILDCAPAVSVHGVKVSLAGSTLVVGTRTGILTMPNPTGSSPESIWTVDSEKYTVIRATGATVPGGMNNAAVSGAVVVIGGSTIVQGGQAVTVDGTAVSLGSNMLVVGSETRAFSAQRPTDLAFANSVFTVGAEKYTLIRPAAPAGSAMAVAVAGTTVFQDGPAVTVNGVPVSLASNKLVVGSTTMTLPVWSTQVAGTSILTVGSDKYTIVRPEAPAGSAIAIAVAGTTVFQDGPAVTVNGVRVSMASNILVVGSRTASFVPPAGTGKPPPSSSPPSSTAVDIGALIWKGIGNGAARTTSSVTGDTPSNPTTGGVVFTGVGTGRGGGMRALGVVVMVMVVSA